MQRYQNNGCQSVSMLANRPTVGWLAAAFLKLIAENKLMTMMILIIAHYS